MISRRFLLPVCILLAMAAVPTVIHSYIGAIDDDGLRTTAVPVRLGDYRSSPTKRSANWAREIYEAHDWFERNYARESGTVVRLFVARSYNLKKLYHHPELAVLYGADFARSQARTFRIGDEDVPVIVLEGNNGRGLAAYVLLYENRYIASPLKFQLETALKLLVGERKAITLVLAYDPTADAAAPFERSGVASVLSEAAIAFRSQAPVAVSQARAR